ncbi:MAG: type VI secretion system tip protein TssI/VgrG [Polyangiaceae bacterium]
MSHAQRVSLEYRAPGIGVEFVVASLDGEEAVSAAYRFDVTVLVPTGESALLDGSLLGTDGHVTIRFSNGNHRVVQGIVEEVQYLEEYPKERAHLVRLRLVPRFNLLAQRTNSRIFQEAAAPTIISEVLAEMGIPFEWRLERQHPLRGYCVQYAETDLAFVTRLLREEDIFFHFEHTNELVQRDQEVLVFLDSPVTYPPIQGDKTLPCRFHAGQNAEECVTQFFVSKRIRPGVATVSDYDPNHPQHDLRFRAALDPAPHAFESRLEYYEHHGQYEQPDATAEKAAITLRQLRRDAELGRGTCWSCRLAPGHLFALTEHPVAAFNQEWVVTKLRHSARHVDAAGLRASADSGEVQAYHAEFECVPSTVACSAPPAERVIRQVVEHATVVGPASEEVYADAEGRIKVQFPWDRLGRRNERSSCWIRVMQPWAGAHRGAQFLPRVGDEVMVTFIGGDQDRPVVVGSVHNATHPSPFGGPQQSTTSGVRSQSTPKSEAYSELRIEDRAGAERIVVRAARDLEQTIVRDHRSEVGGDRSSVVRGSVDTRVERGTTQTVDGPLAIHANRTFSLEVKGDARTIVERDDHHSVRANAYRETAGTERHAVLGDHESSVRGKSATTIQGDQITRVAGHVVHTVGSHHAPASSVHHVDGVAQSISTGPMEIRSSAELRLVCGDSQIVITPSSIQLLSPSILLDGKSIQSFADNHLVVAEEKARVVAATVGLFGAKASLALASKAELASGTISLSASPAAASEAKPTAETKFTRIKLVDQRGQPIPGERWVVTQPDGTKRQGVLDEEGAAAIRGLKGTCEVDFPDVGPWAEAAPGESLVAVEAPTPLEHEDLVSAAEGEMAHPYPHPSEWLPQPPTATAEEETD